MNITMQRLYAATKERYQVHTQTGIANLLNTSPQVIKNWENRGISNQGILDIQTKLNISSHWIKTGNGVMFIEKNNQNTLSNIEKINNFIDKNYGEVAGVFNEKIQDKSLPEIDLNRISFNINLLNDLFKIKVPNNELQDIGIFKDDILYVNPNLAVQHGNILLVSSSDGRGIIAKLFVDLRNQYFLKYNGQAPEMMPQDTRIIGVVFELKRFFIHAKQKEIL